VVLATVMLLFGAALMRVSRRRRSISDSDLDDRSATVPAMATTPDPARGTPARGMLSAFPALVGVGVFLLCAALLSRRAGRGT
jgi:hypothetical protein